MDRYYIGKGKNSYYTFVEFFSEDICHIRIGLREDEVLSFRTGLDRYGFIMQPDNCGGKFDILMDKTPEMTMIHTSKLKVKISGEGSLEIEDSINGQVLQQPLEDWCHIGKMSSVSFLLKESEAIFGLGDIDRSSLNKRGKMLMCNVGYPYSCVPVPFCMSDRGYGLFFNTTYKAAFDIGCGKPDVFKAISRDRMIDFYYIGGPEFKDVIRNYTLLTGTPELPPVWSFGLWYLLRTQAGDYELLNDTAKFRSEGIPCDIIGLEPGWMEKSYDYSVNKT